MSNLPIYEATRRSVRAEWLCDDVELDVWPALSYDEQRALLGLPVAVAA